VNTQNVNYFAAVMQYLLKKDRHRHKRPKSHLIFPLNLDLLREKVQCTNENML